MNGIVRKGDFDITPIKVLLVILQSKIKCCDTGKPEQVTKYAAIRNNMLQ